MSFTQHKQVEENEKKTATNVKHKDARMNFSKDCMTWTEEWKRVIFSEEKKFNLDGLVCYSYYWHNSEVELSKCGALLHMVPSFLYVLYLIE
jgi:hypothetical protein